VVGWGGVTPNQVKSETETRKARERSIWGQGRKKGIKKKNERVKKSELYTVFLFLQKHLGIEGEKGREKRVLKTTKKREGEKVRIVHCLSFFSDASGDRRKKREERKGGKKQKERVKKSDLYTLFLSLCLSVAFSPSNTVCVCLCVCVCICVCVCVRVCGWVRVCVCV